MNKIIWREQRKHVLISGSNPYVSDSYKNVVESYIVILNGEPVYKTKDPRDRDLFIAELKARINIAKQQEAICSMGGYNSYVKTSKAKEDYDELFKEAMKEFNENMDADLKKLEKKLAKTPCKLEKIIGTAINDNKSKLSFVEETTWGTRPCDGPKIIRSNELTKPIQGKPENVLYCSARFDCPSCNKGIYIEIGKTFETQPTPKGLIVPGENKLSMKRVACKGLEYNLLAYDDVIIPGQIPTNI